ncbi:IclR family transcriptional regulator [Rhodoligotrophos defluvii]|uniref:IclR family transcriptional regulator n=1 Tax=Rhodoligotrophos defluvii TaxID=2561934 RepID=UPI0010C980C2|nr:IclR family transcriptional regulator [Rhodoligotrophos defluvii]
MSRTRQPFRSAEATSLTAESANKDSTDRLFVQSVARAFRVLEGFANTPEPMSLSQIAKAAGLDKSGAQRLAYTLTKLGYLEQGAAGGLVPGRKLLERTFDYLKANPLVSRAVPILAELRRDVQERVDLSLFDDLTMLYLVRLQSKRDSFYAHLIGRRVPTFCTSGGRAVLARLPDERVLDILARSDRRRITPRTTVQLEEILKRIEEVRQLGYSLALEEIMIGELAIAAAIVDKDNKPIGAIHVAGSLSEWEPSDFARKFGPLVIAAAKAVGTA